MCCRCMEEKRCNQLQTAWNSLRCKFSQTYGDQVEVFKKRCLNKFIVWPATQQICCGCKTTQSEWFT